jgi:E3 ubiquitin-protein ligase MYCBP2
LFTALFLLYPDKARRQPKPVKPKKMIKVDGLNIVHAACNNGTTAVVSKEGELLMFGKDTAHCDSATGNWQGHCTL